MNNTLFDDIFRTIVEKLPELIIPLINEVFQTDYPADTEITQERNEHQDDRGETITDSRLRIGERVYHIECESTDDRTMALRMIEYDFRIGVEEAQREERVYYMTFPHSCVIYLRDTEKTPDELEVRVNLWDQNNFRYGIPTVKIKNYEKEKLFEKDLEMFLPFYAIRYEKRRKELEEEPEKLKVVLKEYDEICEYLKRKYIEQGRPDLYTDLMSLMRKVAEYIFREQVQVRKGLGAVMGGKVLQLESERLREEGRREGEKIGKERINKLNAFLIQEKRFQDLERSTTDAEFQRKLILHYGVSDAK